MARHLHLQPHLSVAELERRYRSAHDPNERSWWHILWLLSQGHTAVSVAAVTGYSAYWIGQIAKRYNTEGPEAMRNRRHTDSYRPPPALPPALQEELRQLLTEAARREQYWTAQQVASWMSERLGRPVSYQLGWSYLVRLKHSPQVPRSRHALADAEQQAAFKKSEGRSCVRWRRRFPMPPSSCGRPMNSGSG
jgi:transposase